MSAIEKAPTTVPGQPALKLESLRNVIREPLRTCRTCATPVDGFDQCWRCRDHQHIAGLAELVAPLIYAVDGSDSAALLREYKNHPVRATRERPVRRSVSCCVWRWSCITTALVRWLGCLSHRRW